MLFVKNYIIYKITNKINGKVYVGETSVSIKDRWHQHYSKDSNCVKLKRAINKYGKENFKIEQIDHAHNKEEAFIKEKFWISFYKSTDYKCGYNILESGYTSSNRPPKKVYCYETKEVFDSVGACSRAVGMSVELIGNCCRGIRPTCKGLHYCFIGKDGKPMIEKIRWTKPHLVKVICVETGKVFDSIREAARFIGKTEMTIHQCLCGKTNRAGGYHWKRLQGGS